MPKTPRALSRKLTVVFLMVSFLVGCSAPNRHDSIPTAEPSNQLLRALEKAPNKIPILKISKVKVDPAAYDWLTDGRWVRFRAANSEANVRLPSINISNNELDFSLNATQSPTELFVSLFSSLNEQGIPTSETGDEIDCLTSRRCTLDIQDKATHFRVGISDRVRLAVVHVGYLLKAPSGTTSQNSTLVLDIGSWGVRITHKSN